MQNILGKMANIVSSLLPGGPQVSPGAARVKDGQMKQLVVEQRTSLANAICKGKDSTDVIEKLIDLDCPLRDKYAMLQVTELLVSNNQSLEDLKHITSGLAVIVKYAQHLIRKSEQRNEQWRVIHFQNTLVQKKIKPMKGFESVLQQLGYTQATSSGLSFPSGTEPDLELVVNLTCDMMLFRKELKQYILGRHPHPQFIQQLVPTQTQQEVLSAQQLRVMVDEDDLSDVASTQISYVPLEGTDIVLPVVSSDRQPNVDTVIRTDTHLVMQSSKAEAECNNNNVGDTTFQITPPPSVKLPDLSVTSDVTSKEARQSPSIKNLEENSENEIEQFQTHNNEPAQQAIQDLVNTATTNELETGGTLECCSGTSSSLRLTCDVCGNDAAVFCEDCTQKPLCPTCNENWHKHPQRQGHIRRSISALAYMSLPSMNQVNIDGAYGISAQNTTSVARIMQKRQSLLLNEKAAINKSPMDHMLYQSESKRSDGGAEDPTEAFLIQKQFRNEPLQQLKNVYQPSDYQHFQDMHSHHQQFQHRQTVSAAARDPYAVSYQVQVPYHSPVFMHLGQDQGYQNSKIPPGHQLRSDIDSLGPISSKQLFSSGSLNSRQQQQPTMAYAPQQIGGYQRHSTLQQYQRQPQPSGYYHQGMQNRMHSLYAFSQDMTKSQLNRALGSVAYVNSDMTPNTLYQNPDLGATHPSADPMLSFNPHALRANSDQSVRNSGMHHLHSAALLQDNMNAQVNVQNPYSSPRGQIYHPSLSVHQADMSGVYAGDKGPQYAALPMTDSFYNPLALQEPGYQISRQHAVLSSSAPSSTVCLPNTWVDLLNQEKDINKRCAMCNAYIGKLARHIKDLEQQINQAMEEDIEVCDTEEFRTWNKQKALMMQQKKGLEEYRRNLEDETILMKMNFEEKMPEEMLQQIHYPPDIDLSSRPSSKKLPNPPAGVDETANVASNAAAVAAPPAPDVTAAGPHTDHKQNASNNNAQVTGNSDLALSSQSRATVEDKISANSAQVKVAATSKPSDSSQQSSIDRIGTRDFQGLRVAVEASDKKVDNMRQSPPALPKRLVQTDNILKKTFPPPKLPVLQDIKNWQCQHCTYINSASAHVCAMCDRTSDNPQFVSMSDDEGSEAGKSDKDNKEPDDKSMKKDTFLSMLQSLLQNKQEETQDDDDDEEEERLNADEREHLGHRISGSQEQVMLEKKQAQKEFMLQQQQQQQLMGSKSSAEAQHQLFLKSQSPTPIGAAVDADQRQKPSHSPRPGLETNEQSSINSSDYHTPPSATRSFPSSTVHRNTSPRPPRSQKILLGQEKDEGAYNSDSKLEDTIARFNEISLIDTMHTQGAEFSKLIKMAEIEGFDVEALQIAQGLCKNQNIGPIEWLKNNWQKNINMVANMAITAGNRQAENNVGEVSEKEAESAYISCHGNMKDAAELCMNKRTELYKQLSALGDFPREEILQVMLQCHGNRENAESVLIESKLQPFAENIWAEREMESRSRFAFGLAGAPLDMCHSFSTSIIFHVDFQKMIRNKDVERDRRIRMIFIEGKLKSWGRAELVIKILDNDLPGEDISLEDVVEAVRNCQDRNSALAYLQQECALCFTNFPMSKIRSLNICQCKMCEQCLANYFEIEIREKHVRHWTCPLCSLPDMNDADVASDYLQFLILLLQPLIDRDLQNLFEIKVRDWHLQKDVSFRWCAHCAEGFLAENQGGHLRMTCPHCQEKTCFKCKKQWEPQHEGLTCEQFAQWKIDNDPSNQSVGLAKHLDENGIDCPNCKMRFALAKGGCMHFKCPQCGYEFCSGCNEPFHQKDVCTKYKSCKKLGLHCHCPRDCFSYLRDKPMHQLQHLLKLHNKPFNVSIPDDQTDPQHCPVMEQKEFDLGKKDEKCGKDTAQGQAGLCEIHYKEYLVDIINRNGLDPVVLMTKDEMITLLHRYDLHTPKQKPKQTPEEQLIQLREVIQEKLPLRQR